jgi:predicted HAD superfamily Cof-like phosphohydrolase
MAPQDAELRDHGTSESRGRTSAVQVAAGTVAGADEEDILAATLPDPSSGHSGLIMGREAEAGDRAQSRGSRMEADRARMSDAMASVVSFHEAFGLPRASRPGTDIPTELAKLRVDLLAEEIGEFADASARNDIVGIADALADIVYVAYGAAVTYGIDLDAALREVHQSNMSKLDEQGRPVQREDGKVLKSGQYRPPDISGILSRQPPLSLSARAQQSA